MAKQIVEEQDWGSEIEEFQASFRSANSSAINRKPIFRNWISRFPDSVESPILAPLYDVHCGSPQQDEPLLDKHLDWIANTSNVFTWDGGDVTENITDFKMGHTPMSNEDQVYTALANSPWFSINVSLSSPESRRSALTNTRRHPAAGVSRISLRCRTSEIMYLQ